MTWPSMPLGELLSLKYGKSLKANDRVNGIYTVMGSNGTVGTHSSGITSGRTVIIGRKGSIGKIAYSARSCWPIDTTYFIDEASTEQDIRWLYWQLQLLSLDQMNKSAAIPGLNRDDVYRARIPVPPLEEQRRIAAILDHAEELRARRRRALTLLDELAAATFVQYFGDVVSNDRAWDASRVLDDVARVVSGITKGRTTREDVRTIPYLTVANVQERALKLDVVKNIEATEREISRFKLKLNDLLLTEGGDPDKLGRGTLWGEELPECIHQNHVFRVRVLETETLNPLFLSWLVASRMGKRYFERASKQTTGIASINSTQLRAFPLLCPPIEVQDSFASLMRRYERLKAVNESHLIKLDELFSSLQRQAFTGEL